MWKEKPLDSIFFQIKYWIQMRTYEYAEALNIWVKIIGKKLSSAINHVCNVSDSVSGHMRSVVLIAFFQISIYLFAYYLSFLRAFFSLLFSPPSTNETFIFTKVF